MKKLTSLLCAVIIILSFAGCTEREGSAEVVGQFCKAARKLDTETMESFLASDEKIIEGPVTKGMPDTDIVEDYCRRSAKKIKFKILSTDEYSDSAEVCVRIQFQDSFPLIRNVMKEYSVSSVAKSDDPEDAEFASGFFEDLFKKYEKETTVYTGEELLTFNCTLTNDGWKITELPDNFRNIVVCNMARVARKPFKTDIDAFFETGPYLDHEYEDWQLENPQWTDVPLGETVNLDCASFRINSIKEGESSASSYDFISSQEGAKFLFVNMEITNLSSESFYLATRDFMLEDSQGRRYNADDSANVCLGNSLLYYDLNPGEPVTGDIIFNIPEDSEDCVIIIREYGSDIFYRMHLK